MRSLLVEIAVGVVVPASILDSPSFGQTASGAASTGHAISPYLVGATVWHRPGDEVWRVTSKAGNQIVRIGGGAYDRSMPSNDQ